MAQHSLTFNDILSKNIRYIYGGRPNEIKHRRPVNQHVMELRQKEYEKQVRPPDRFQLRFQEYLPKFNITLPRAPAFRQVSRSEMNSIVCRVSKPTNFSKKPCEICHREIARQYQDMCLLCEMSRFKHTVSRAEMRAIVSRLSRQTESSKRRNLLRTVSPPDPKSRVRPCTAEERLRRPSGRIDCYAPCRIIHDTRWRKRPRSTMY